MNQTIVEKIYFGKIKDVITSYTKEHKKWEKQ